MNAKTIQKPLAAAGVAAALIIAGPLVTEIINIALHVFLILITL